MIDRDNSFESDLSPSLREVAAVAAAPTAANELQQHVQGFVGEDLQQVEKYLRSATSSRYAAVERLSQSAAGGGGKRLRPTLVFLSAYACQQAPLSLAQRADLQAIATAVELVHAASLVHDDVMDAAAERRHQPTIVDQAGNSAAVLLGDFLFTRGYALAASCRSTVPARRIAAAATELCEGELRQQASAGAWDISLAEYRSLLLQKTGALCAVSCRLGAWRAAAPRPITRALQQFGNLLGLAFQIYDDWLDYWGTQQVGKTLGTDLAQLKPTLPLIRLLQTTSASRRAQLLELLRVPGEADREQVLRLLDASDAAQFTLRIARRCVTQAKAKLATLPATPARQCLLAVADYSVRRSL
ncbi:MAG: polyprenyl synthetase family protein [Planctomycetales bacterium]|nr:polyprenyl synthetase family protein [Planctomycetales bacterium]